MSQSAYERDLDRRAANFQPLTPLAFLERAAAVFPERLAVVPARCAALTANFTRVRRAWPRRSPSGESRAATRSR